MSKTSVHIFCRHDNLAFHNEAHVKYFQFAFKIAT